MIVKEIEILGISRLLSWCSSQNPVSVITVRSILLPLSCIQQCSLAYIFLPTFTEKLVQIVCVSALSKENFTEVLHAYRKTLLQKAFQQIHKLQIINLDNSHFISMIKSIISFLKYDVRQAQTGRHFPTSGVMDSSQTDRDYITYLYKLKLNNFFHLQCHKVHASSTGHVIQNTSAGILNALQLGEICIMNENTKTKIEKKQIRKN